MSQQQFEIEIKSLLGNHQVAEELIEKMTEREPDLTKSKTRRQLNHYFEGGDLAALAKNVAPILKNAADRDRLEEIVATAKSFSLRTRQNDSEVLFILKISIDDTSSDNGTARMEFEVPVEGLTLAQLDELILKSGFKYQAKWSREKTDYNYRGTTVTLSFSPGYGYVAEFEKIVTDPKLADQTKAELRGQMAELGVEELAQDRLARMFAYYNANWPDYYGTDKVFEIQ